MYVPSSRKIISSYDVVFDEIFSSELEYTSQPYLEAMAMHPSVTYTPCDTSSREQTGDIITFTQFEEGNLVSETREDTESSNEFDNNSTLLPLIIEEEMDTMSSEIDSDAEPMSTDMFEYFRDSNQSHPGINRREARYKICDHIKRVQ